MVQHKGFRILPWFRLRRAICCSSDTLRASRPTEIAKVKVTHPLTLSDVASAGNWTFKPHGGRNSLHILRTAGFDHQKMQKLDIIKVRFNN